MKRYKIYFDGFAYVEADNEAEAQENFFEEIHIFSECGITAIDEVDEFIVKV